LVIQLDVQKTSSSVPGDSESVPKTTSVKGIIEGDQYRSRVVLKEPLGKSQSFHLTYTFEKSTEHDLGVGRCVRMRQYGSNLTTPPNSPEPELMTVFAYDVEPKSMSLQMVFGFIVSNIVTFVLGAAVGFAICKRLVKERKI
uniref:COPIIcoated_ERV domain-containing protein n=1 Tax=Heligmosomoides polygyrus TaxID=6339 RepID=A0A183G846_HELPZ